MPSRLSRRLPAVVAVSAALSGGLAVAAPLASAATGLAVTPHPILDTGSHTLTVSGLTGLYLQTPNVQLVGPSPSNGSTYSGTGVSYDSTNHTVTATFGWPPPPSDSTTDSGISKPAVFLPADSSSAVSFICPSSELEQVMSKPGPRLRRRG